MAAPSLIRPKQILTAGFASLALQLQEAAAAELSNGDVVRRLSDAVRESCKGTGIWCYYITHFGDAEAGDVVYCQGDETYRATYSIGEVAGKATCSIDTEAAVKVVPRTVFDETAEDADHYVAMEAERLYLSATEAPLYERFIAKDERTSADKGSFAGKGKSFPILKPADVMAAVRAIGRAGSDNYDAETLKANIIRIATKKGWAKELPKAWRAKESAPPEVPSDALRLVEATQLLEDIPLREAFKTGYKIKLIAPGKGAMAFYTEEVLKRDGPKVFREGTPMRIDHPTSTEEADRPEGSVKDWGAVLSREAYWLDKGPAGAGLYGEVKPFSDHAQTIEEKGPYAGVSISAYGQPVRENGKVVLREGVPLLASLTRADGVDMVTRAGAGGMFLSEAAKPPISNEGGADTDMDAAELKKLQESLALREANETKLLERAIRGDAREFAVRVLKGITLHEAGKDLVIESVMRDIPQKDGGLDEAKFTEAINAEAKRVGSAIAAATGSGRVVGMGAAAPAEVDAKEAARAKAAGEQRLKESVRAFRDMGMPEPAAKRAAEKDWEAA